MTEASASICLILATALNSVVSVTRILEMGSLNSGLLAVTELVSNDRNIFFELNLDHPHRHKHPQVY